MSYCYCLYNQAKHFDFSAVFRSACHDIDPGGIDTAVAQDICQLGDVLFNAVKRACKQLS